MTITNFELIELAKSYGINNLNVIMNDELTNYSFNTGYYIINLEDSTESGSHWTAVIVEEGKGLYWDSFGCVPSLQVEDFLHKSKHKYVFNNKIVQDLRSTKCGLFSLGCIIYVIKDTTKSLYEAVNDYTNLFSHDAKKNDKIIDKLYKTKFNNIK